MGKIFNDGIYIFIILIAMKKKRMLNHDAELDKIKAENKGKRWKQV